MIDATHPATQAQVRAALPDRSSWVSANAGSGKTRVLTDRVARLLLRGTDPQKILCLTYTKAAAAEMQNRLFERLGEWAMMSDDRLRDTLAALGEEDPIADLRQARTLFARALETPGGLKIQTIHAFCDLLLRRFPLEAGVSPQFEVMEDRQAEALRSDCLEALAEADPGGVFSDLLPWLGGTAPDDLLRDILARRKLFLAPPDAERLRALVGAPSDGRVEARLADLKDTISSDDLAALADAWDAHGSASEKKLVPSLRAVLEQGAPGAMDALADIFLKKSDDRQPKTNNFPTKGLRDASPWVVEFIPAAGQAVWQMYQDHLAAQAFEKALALHRFSHAYLNLFTQRKAAMARLDFDDLITKARTLLQDSASAAWVLYRLDGGIDHILVDEAQDTSPAQWDVVRTLAEDFFAGEGARDEARTIFVVGDEKQSIYSFQGAEPSAFGDMRMHFDQTLERLDGLALCELLYSFRSSPAILRLVDQVFESHDGLGVAQAARHAAFHSEKPGRVELWPFLEAPEKAEEAAWYEPVDQPPRSDPRLQLARQIADRLARMLASGTELPGADRAVQPGDVLILVQRRSTLFRAIISALKTAGVPVAGADRVQLGGELAVRDLLSLLRFLNTPENDLALAEVLRSPIGGLSEADLFSLAHGREGLLWNALRARETEFPELVTCLQDLRGQVDYLRPFEIIERVLTRHGRRKPLIARLGPEAEEAIDALLDQALLYETVEPPSLTGFLNWFTGSDVEIKRQLDPEDNRVRVMTVHGAKGLEAPIVILPDTAKARAPNPPQVATLPSGEAVWSVSSKQAPQALREAEAERRRQAEEERARLLYVALTRAETWLIICGAGDRGQGQDCWYGMIETAMGELGAADDGGLVLSENWSSEQGLAALPDRSEHELHDPDLAEPAQSAAIRAKLIAPSALGGAHALPGPDGMDEAEALAYGDAMHRLLEHLPRTAPEQWESLAETLLAALDQPLRKALLTEATGVLTAPHLAPLFGPEALVEIPVTTALVELGDAQMLGTIDRLLVRPDKVTIVDFKSNRVEPTQPEYTPEAILRQMGAYHAAIAQIYPDREIEIAIVWTKSARFMTVPHSSVIAALQRGDPG